MNIQLFDSAVGARGKTGHSHKRNGVEIFQLSRKFAKEFWIYKLKICFLLTNAELYTSKFLVE